MGFGFGPEMLDPPNPETTSKPIKDVFQFYVLGFLIHLSYRILQNLLSITRPNASLLDAPKSDHNKTHIP